MLPRGGGGAVREATSVGDIFTDRYKLDINACNILFTFESVKR